MCDYSLHVVSSRPAKAMDRLVTTSFPHTLTRGFSAVGEPSVAVCLRPGTELAFGSEVKVQQSLLQLLFSAFAGKKNGSTIRHKVCRFRQIELSDPNTHHDAVEFPDGRVVLLTHLFPGQLATVLQMPADRLDAATRTEVQTTPTEARAPARA